MHTDTMVFNERPLRRALLSNAVFSTGCGLLLLTPLSAPVAAWLGRGWTVALGLGLIAFAWTVAREARQTPLDRGKAVGITLADLGWVLATSVLLWRDYPPSQGPAVATVVSNVAVLALAGWQALGLRQATRAKAG